MKRRLFSNPSNGRYIEITWAQHEVEIATGRRASKRTKVQTRALASEEEACAFVTSRVADAERRGFGEVAPTLLDRPRESPAAIPQRIAALGHDFVRFASSDGNPLGVPLYVSPATPEAHLVYERALAIPGYATVIVGPGGYDLLEAAADDKRVRPAQRRALARRARTSPEERLRHYLSSAERGRDNPFDTVPEEMRTWGDATRFAQLQSEATVVSEWTRAPAPEPAGRVVIAECAPEDVPLAIPIHYPNNGPDWRELADVLSSWHERYGARLSHLDHGYFQVEVERVPTTLDDLRRLAREHAIVGCDYDFRVPVELRDVAIPTFIARAAMEKRWCFAYD
jgi:hypothetical protein